MTSLMDAVNIGMGGGNKGLHFYSKKLNQWLGGIHPFYYAISGSPKTGKTSYLDLNFIIGPYLAGEAHLLDYHYFSTEISLIEKQAKIVSVLAYIKHKLKISSETILGRKMDQYGKPIYLTPQEYNIVKQIYETDIIAIFGEYDVRGTLIRPGFVTFYPGRPTPLELASQVWGIAKANGSIQTQKITTTVKGQPIERTIVTNYTRYNDKKTMILIDHIRGLGRIGSPKETVDLMSAHLVDIRNYFKFGAAVIIHANRDQFNTDRIKLNRERLYPSEESIKDSGNVLEDCDCAITLFNPNDDVFAITKHFGFILADFGGKYRSAHVIRARNAGCPLHFPLLFEGGVAHFEDIVVGATPYGTLHT